MLVTFEVRGGQVCSVQIQHVVPYQSTVIIIAAGQPTEGQVGRGVARLESLARSLASRVGVGGRADTARKAGTRVVGFS